MGGKSNDGCLDAFFPRTQTIAGCNSMGKDFYGCVVNPHTGLYGFGNLKKVKMYLAIRTSSQQSVRYFVLVAHSIRDSIGQEARDSSGLSLRSSTKLSLISGRESVESFTKSQTEAGSRSMGVELPSSVILVTCCPVEGIRMKQLIPKQKLDFIEIQSQACSPFR